MMIPPREVSPGDKISATRWNALIRYLRAITPKAGPGVKASVGPNGTILSADVSARTRQTPVVPGRFAIRAMRVSDEGKLSLTLTNLIYRCGGKSYQLQTDQEANEPTLADIELPAIVSLKIRMIDDVPNASLVTHGSFELLQVAEGDTSEMLLPLYSFDESGALACDWRIGPDSIQFEF